MAAEVDPSKGVDLNVRLLHSSARFAAYLTDDPISPATKLHASFNASFNASNVGEGPVS